jgi:hypothetical protein
MFHPSHILKTLVHQQRPAIKKKKMREPSLIPEEQDEELSLPG